MTTAAPLSTKQETTMRKYMSVLNEISDLGIHGFAAVIDSSNAAELDELEAAVDTVLRQIARWKAVPR